LWLPLLLRVGRGFAASRLARAVAVTERNQVLTVLANGKEKSIRKIV
jgi:DNA-binding Xre family transcriptional regulator